FIGFFRGIRFSSVFHKNIPNGLIFPRNSVGIFRGNSEETKFCVSSEYPRKFLGIFRGFHFPSECPSEYCCFLVVMVLSEHVPDLITLNTLVNGLCLKGYLSESVYINRPNGGNAPNDCTYNSLIRAHLRYGDSAKSATLIEEMKRCGFAADASTIKMVMDILVDGRLDKSFLDMLT
ncbi:unnamed protein product, partial [Brassica oleracea]